MDGRALLERAAADVISIMKGMSDLSEASIAVIGGLALWMYAADGRTTQDVDFIINIDSAPQSVKSKLLALPNSPFTQQAQYFLYRDREGNQIQIDITPAWQVGPLLRKMIDVHSPSIDSWDSHSPYLPAAATKLSKIPTGSVPDISALDLLIFKMNSCGLRAQPSKSIVDANDAEALLARMITPLALTSRQMALVEPLIADMVSFGAQTEDWWRQELGFRPLEPPVDDYWTWSEEYQNWYLMNDDGTYEWMPQEESSSAGPSQKPKKSTKGKGKDKRRKH